MIPEHVAGPQAAGWEALRKADWMGAHSAFEQALAVGESAEAFDGLAQAAWWRADVQGAISAWERAYAGFRHSGLDVAAARVALRLWEEYEKTLAVEAVANGWLARAEDALAGLEACEGHGRVLLARATRALDPASSYEYAEQALHLARRLGDPDLELAALGKVGLAEISLGLIDRGATRFDAAMAAATSGESHDLRTLGDLYCALFLACEVMQDTSRFEQWTDVLMGFVQTHHHPELLTFCGTCCAELFSVAGQWSEVEKQLLDTLRALEASGQRARCLHPSVRLAALRIEQGRFEDAERLLLGFEDLPEATQPTVTLHLVRGEVALAAARLHRRLNQVGHSNLLAVPLLAQLVEVQLTQSDTVGAAETAAEIRAVAERSGSDKILAAAELAGGMVGAARRSGSAAAQIGRAIDLYARLRMPHFAARAHLALARLIRSQDPKGAVHEAKQALRTFEELGATRDSDQAAGLLRELGVGGRTGPKALRGLSKREHDVLNLLAEGLTNAEIAARLYVSTKTIDTHVGNILSKLGVRNRGEAGAWAHRNLH